jgi:hypothetical protein
VLFAIAATAPLRHSDRNGGRPFLFVPLLRDGRHEAEEFLSRF